MDTSSLDNSTIKSLTYFENGLPSIFFPRVLTARQNFRGNLLVDCSRSYDLLELPRAVFCADLLRNTNKEGTRARSWCSVTKGSMSVLVNHPWKEICRSCNSIDLSPILECSNHRLNMRVFISYILSWLYLIYFLIKKWMTIDREYGCTTYAVSVDIFYKKI